MAIEKNDINHLNRIEIKAENNRTFKDDVRSVLFLTMTETIEPKIVTDPKDLSGILTSESVFYQMVASAFSQKLNPVKVVVYGNKTAKKISQLIQEYEKHNLAVEVSNYGINDTLTEVQLSDLIETAKTDKKHIYHLGMKKSENAITREGVDPLETKIKQINLDNVAIYVEGDNNVNAKNWLVGAVLGGVIGAKELGKYIVHSSQIVGFLKENYTKEEQMKFKEIGLNFISQPIKNYIYLVNGIATDNKMYLDLKLAQLWLADNLQKDITVLQIVNDKLKFQYNKGIDYVRTTILNVCQKGADMGIFLTDSTGNYFGIYSQKDSNGNPIDIRLGELNLSTLTQEDIREGNLNFNLTLTYDTGIRHITLYGTVTTDGILIIK